MVADINRLYGDGSPVVVLKEGDRNLNSILGVLKAADVYLDTSINDGLNVHPWLFLAAHSQDLHGSLVVSEFIGATDFLTGARKFNPWNTQQVMNSLHEALTEEEHHRLARFKKDHSYASGQNLCQWISQNLDDLKAATNDDSDTGKEGHLSIGSTRGAGPAMFLMNNQGFRHLGVEAVLRDYRAAKTRAIFLDCEGTLAPDACTVLRPFIAANNVEKNVAQLDL